MTRSILPWSRYGSFSVRCSAQIIRADQLSLGWLLIASPEDSLPAHQRQGGIFIGLIIGGLVASWLSGDTSGTKLPELWTQRFGTSRAKSSAMAFIAGIILIYGARLAGGCTSGHGISGSLQLAGSSWAFFFSLFASSLATAFLLLRKRR